MAERDDYLATRDQGRPLALLTDRELAVLGALGGYAPIFRENFEEVLENIGRLAGMEENRRTAIRQHRRPPGKFPRAKRRFWTP